MPPPVTAATPQNDAIEELELAHKAAQQPPDLRSFLQPVGVMEVRYVRMLSSLCGQTYFLQKLTVRLLRWGNGAGKGAKRMCARGCWVRGGRRKGRRALVYCPQALRGRRVPVDTGALLLGNANCRSMAQVSRQPQLLILALPALAPPPPATRSRRGCGASTASGW